MKETDFLKTISDTLHRPELLGDDCAYLADLDVFITQDTLVENVHFSLKTTSVFDLGCKSAAICLSDLAAAASKPLYLTVSLSLPSFISNDFVKEFYTGIDKICEKYNVVVAGGDLTGSDKVVVSVCALGKRISKYEVSRSNAREGDVVFVTGPHGESAAALKLCFKHFAKKHLRPEPKIDEGLLIANSAQRDFALMDSSDGLGDALFKIAQKSNVEICVDYRKIPKNSQLENIFKEETEKLVLWGGEDFELVGCVDAKTFKKLDKSRFFEIGTVLRRTENGLVTIDFADKLSVIDESAFESMSFDHFEEIK